VPLPQGVDESLDATDLPAYQEFTGSIIDMSILYIIIREETFSLCPKNHH
jgi:hypothetical protein